MADKIIAVTGATGAQGGGVVNVMKKTPGWKVRAVTRNPESDAAKKLAAEGVEVVVGDFNDEASLVKAFEGVSAVFAVTNWWESLFTGSSQHEAGAIEESHGMNLALAASKTPTLEHYLWSTQPSSKAKFFESHGLETPHMDYKARNMAFFPLLKPFPYPGSGQHIQILASDPNAKVLLAGDMSVNPGIWTRQVLASGPKAFAKYTNVALERWSFKEMMDKWSEITGKKGRVVQVSEEEWTAFWGPAGRELSWQFKFGELCDPWEVGSEHISAEELGIEEKEVVGFEGTIKAYAAAGLFD